MNILICLRSSRTIFPPRPARLAARTAVNRQIFWSKPGCLAVPAMLDIPQALEALNKVETWVSYAKASEALNGAPSQRNAP